MKFSGSVSLRSATSDDRGFLLRVYASTREQEMAAWGWSPSQQAAFVQMQFQARERSYAIAYPGAQISVIQLGNEAIGSLIVSRSPQEIRLVDISLLIQYQSQGIGSGLLRQLIDEAKQTKTPLRLSVLADSRATHLYQRLGFRPGRQDAVYREMEYSV